MFTLAIGGVSILGWKHLMTFTPSTRYCPVRHSPSFAIPQLSPTTFKTFWLTIKNIDINHKRGVDIHFVSNWSCLSSQFFCFVFPQNCYHLEPLSHTRMNFLQENQFKITSPPAMTKPPLPEFSSTSASITRASKLINNWIYHCLSCFYGDILEINKNFKFQIVVLNWRSSWMLWQN